MTTSAAYIRTGAMRHRAALQARSATPDSYGGNAVTWTTERDVWCQIRELSGQERLAAMRQESAVTHEVYARYAADLTASKRLVHAGVAYNIRAVMNPETRNEFVRMLAESGVAT